MSHEGFIQQMKDAVKRCEEGQTRVVLFETEWPPSYPSQTRCFGAEQVDLSVMIGIKKTINDLISNQL